MTTGRRALRAALAALAVGVALVTLAAPARADAGAPYQDPAATGYLGFCNQAGQQITSGSINTTPFVWRAVSSQPAPAPYNMAGRTAILLAYQPRSGLAPGEWSGDELTASARYTNPDHPMAAATAGDESLEGFISDFPPQWDGFLQIRIYLGLPEHAAYSLTYSAADIQVVGSTWHQVGGGPVSCTSGTSESIESILLPASVIKSAANAAKQASATKPASTTSPAPSTRPNSGRATGRPSPTTAQSSSPTVTTPASSAAANQSSNGSGWAIGVIAVVVAGLLLVAFLVLRRRRLASSGPNST